MTISFRLNETEADMIKAYAKMQGMTVSELIRKIVMDHIEEKSDLQEYENASAEYDKDPETFTLDDVIKELDLA